jgi:hypothetical protein
MYKVRPCCKSESVANVVTSEVVGTYRALDEDEVSFWHPEKAVTNTMVTSMVEIK